MLLVGEERREFQRLRLDPTVPATLGDVAVSILEIGVLGARVRHSDPIGKEYAELYFSHTGKNIGMRCEIVRTINNESGLRFLAAIDESGDKLRSMLADLVTHEFQVRRNMPANSIPANALSVDGDRTVRGADAAF